MPGNRRHRRRIAFTAIAAASARNADIIVRRWLPDGHREGNEWVSLNPRRADSRPGSFKVNLVTGRWGDFASGDKGGDLVALAAFLFNLKQSDAAGRLAQMIGAPLYE